MFIRKKRRNGRDLFYAVKSSRDKNGRTKQKFVAYLGDQPSIAKRKAQLVGRIRSLALAATDARRQVNKWNVWLGRKGQSEPQKPRRGESRSANAYAWSWRRKLAKLELAHTKEQSALNKLRAATRTL